MRHYTSFFLTMLIIVLGGTISANPFSFDQILTASTTCAVEGVNPISFTFGFGVRNGCSDSVRGTETTAVIDLRSLDEMLLLFTVGNFPCSETQIVTFRDGETESVCGSPPEIINPRDVLVTYGFSFPDAISLDFDINV